MEEALAQEKEILRGVGQQKSERQIGPITSGHGKIVVCHRQVMIYYVNIWFCSKYYLDACVCACTCLIILTLTITEPELLSWNEEKEFIY